MAQDRPSARKALEHPWVCEGARKRLHTQGNQRGDGVAMYARDLVSQDFIHFFYHKDT